MRILLYHQCIIYPEEERTRVPACYTAQGQYYHQSDITPDMQAVFDNTQYPDSIRNGYLNQVVSTSVWNTCLQNHHGWAVVLKS